MRRASRPTRMSRLSASSGSTSTGDCPSRASTTCNGGRLGDQPVATSHAPPPTIAPAPIANVNEFTSAPPIRCGQESLVRVSATHAPHPPEPQRPVAGDGHEHGLANGRAVRGEVVAGEHDEQRHEPGDDDRRVLHRRARPLTGDLDASLTLGRRVGRRGDVVEHLTDLSATRCRHEPQRRDDQVADRVVEVGGEIIEHSVERFVLEPPSHSLQLWSDRQRRCRGDGNQHALDTFRRAHPVAQHLGPQRDRLGAPLVGHLALAFVHADGSPPERRTADRSDRPAGDDGDDDEPAERRREHAVRAAGRSDGVSS